MDASDETVGRYTLLTVAVGPARVRRVVLAAPDSTVGELAGALGTGTETPLWIDGRCRQPEETLREAGVVWGSAVDVDRRVGLQPTSTADPSDAVVMVRCTAGPAAGERIRLGVGRHLLGRSPAAAVRIDDPSLELHALLVDVAANGRVEMMQLTGRVPATIDAEPIDGRCVVPPGSVVHVGASRIELERLLPPAPRALPRTGSGATTGTGEVPAQPSPWVRYWPRRERSCERRPPPVRAGSAATDPPDRPVRVVAPPPRRWRDAGWSRGRWVGALVAATVAGWGLAGAVGTGAWLTLTFAFIAGLGVVAGRAGVTWSRRRSAHTRDGRVSQAATGDVQRRVHLARHRRQVPAADALVEIADDHGARLWERRAHDDDALTVTLGYGLVELGSCERAEANAAWRTQAVADDERVPLTLTPGRLVALVGDARPLARSIVTQLAITTGPADWGLWVITDRPGEWDWTQWLPQDVSLPASDIADRSLAELAVAVRAAADVDRLVVCVDVADPTDIVDELIGPGDEASGSDGDDVDEPTPRGQGGEGERCAIVVLADDETCVPAVAGTRVFVGSRHRGNWTPDRDDVPLVSPVHVAGLSSRTALRVALRLACLADPDVPAQRAVRMAAMPRGTDDAPPFRVVTNDP